MGLATILLLLWGRGFPWLLATVSGVSVGLLAFVSVLSFSRLLRQVSGPSFKVADSLTEQPDSDDRE